MKTANGVGFLRVGCIPRIRDIECCIYHGNIMATAFVQSLKEFLAFIVWIPDLIIVEITVTMHIVDVIPVLQH